MSSQDHHIERIRDAIFSNNAACMIGAGYSRNAVPINGGTNTFPDWQTMVGEIAARLYKRDSDDFRDAVQAAGTTSGALRLAEEFEAAFNRSDLNRLVEGLTPDELHVPGEPHTKLLELPWNDVFTTNYDTLLETSARDIFFRPYTLVTKVDDLPSSSRPRIIKLHGSMPDVRPYIITEEDFRTYRTKYAPFVNEFRVSAMENVLCLFGFSGDDPNFLTWTGWVRDQLGEHAPPIYWFHLKKTIKSFQRRLLEQRSVIPISLPELLGDEPPAVLFLQLFSRFEDRFSYESPKWSLHPAAPQSFWSHAESNETAPSQTPSKDDILTEVEIWKENRTRYLGWYVLTTRRINQLWWNTRFWEDGIRKHWDSFSTDQQVKITCELLWRHEKCLQPLWDNFVENHLYPLVWDWLKETTHPNRHQLAIEVLRHSRETSGWRRHKKLRKWLLVELETGKLSGDSLDFLTHELCLEAISFGQIQSARTIVEEWDTAFSASHWLLRRAAVAFEIRNTELGLRLVDKVRERVKEDSSLDNFYLRSVEAWALLLASKYQPIEEEGLIRGSQATGTPRAEGPLQRLKKFETRLLDLMKCDALSEKTFNTLCERVAIADATANEWLRKHSPSITPGFGERITTNGGTMQGLSLIHI